MKKKRRPTTKLERDVAKLRRLRLPGTFFDDEALRIAAVVDANKDLAEFDDTALRILNTMRDVGERHGIDELTQLAVAQLSMHHYLLGLIAAAAGKPFEQLRPEDVIAVAVHSRLPKSALEAPSPK